MYRELCLEVAREQAEALSDALLEAGALSVSVEDADADTEDEQPLFGEPGLEPRTRAWQRSRIVALIDADSDADALLQTASQSVGIDTPACTSTTLADQDWVRLTQSQFDPILVGKRIWVVPSWHQAPDPAALILELDPGLAFGTGSHPTTRLCMEWLEENIRPGASVLDYGCGSGILAILAAKCGAKPVLGIDIDEQAIEAARANSDRNGTETTFGLPDSSDLPEALRDRRYDIVVANILSNPLKVLAAMLCARLAPGGRLALSGVLARQAQEVAQVYRQWVDIDVWRELDGWVCLAGNLRQGAFTEQTNRPLDP